MSDKKGKRKRDPNMSGEDKSNLMDLITKYFNIIENKKTDSDAMLKKNEVWNCIQQEYNAISNLYRTVEVLKNCWKNLKGEAKKVAAQERQARIKTGGGPATQVVCDPTIDRVLFLIRPTAVGLLNPFDFDETPIFNIQQDHQINDDEAGHEVLEETAESNEEDLLTGDWSKYNSSQLRTPRTRILSQLADSKVELKGDSELLLDLPIRPQVEIGEVLCLSPSSQATSLGPGPVDHPITTEQPSTSQAQTLPCRTTAETSTRHFIRPLTAKEITPKSSSVGESSRHLLSSRRRPVVSQSKNDELINKTIESLASASRYAAAEHDLDMQIKRERLKQEKIKTELLLIKLESARQKKNKSDSEVRERFQSSDSDSC